MSRSSLWALAGAALLATVWWHWRIAAPIPRVASLKLMNYDLYAYYFPSVQFAFENFRHGHLPLLYLGLSRSCTS